MSEPNAIPPTLQILLDFIRSYVSDQHSRFGLPTNGAILADAIRNKFRTESFEQFGVSKLSEAVSIAESKGFVRRDWKAKHLLVLPAGVPQETAPVEGQTYGGLHIRSDIWRAFVYVGRNELHFFDRQENKVVELAAAEDARSAERYVEIKPIPISIQQRWMEEFLQSHNIAAADAPIHDPYCFTKFPAWLMGHNPTLEREWKRFRVSRVADWVREWSVEHAVPIDQFIESARPRSELATPVSRGIDESVLREAIITAVREMPLDQISDFAIPVRYLLRALQGR